MVLILLSELNLKQKQEHHEDSEVGGHNSVYKHYMAFCFRFF